MDHVDDRPPAAPYSMSPLGYVPPSAPRDTVKRRGYRSPRTLARWTLGLFGITIALQMVRLFALGEQRSLLNRGVGQISLAEWHTSSARLENIATVGLILLVVTATLFLMWLFRCYVNLRELGVRNLRFTPGWAVGYWFIPIVNLFRSKQILDELWRATSPAETGEKTWVTAFWLAALLAGTLTERIAVSAGADTIGDLKFTNLWEMISALADITAAALAYGLVSTLTARQESRVA
jgi:uncharacterized membrane protein YiaA